MTGSPESCQTVPQPALSNSASEWGGYSSRSNETVGPGHQVWWSSTNPIVLFCLIFLIVWFCKKKENVFGTLSNTPVTYLYIVNMYFNLLMSYNKYDQCSWWAGVSNCTRAETRSHLRKRDKILFFFFNIYINYQYYCLTDMYWYWRVSCQMFFNALPNATLQGIVSPPGIKLDTFCLSG